MALAIESAHLRWLTWTFIANTCDKYITKLSSAGSNKYSEVSIGL